MTKFSKYRVILQCGSLLVFGVLSAGSYADCLSQVKTAYEDVYCRIKEKGEGKSLPTLEDFRRNNTQVQALLLRRPAEKAKIALPSVEKVIEDRDEKVVKSNVETSSTINRRQGVDEKSATRLKTNNPSTSEKRLPTASEVSQCQLKGEEIDCSGRKYSLQENTPNHRLSSHVWRADYRMRLPMYRGNPSDGIEIQYYLSDTYALYLDKMLSIGLGASTMSYSRFYHTFHDLRKKKVSFTHRFETMFEFLKKDKQSMMIQARLSDKLPQRITDCDEINRLFITCDLDSVNWVYRLQ